MRRSEMRSSRKEELLTTYRASLAESATIPPKSGMVLGRRTSNTDRGEKVTGSSDKSSGGGVTTMTGQKHKNDRNQRTSVPIIKTEPIETLARSQSDSTHATLVEGSSSPIIVDSVSPDPPPGLDIPGLSFRDAHADSAVNRRIEKAMLSLSQAPRTTVAIADSGIALEVNPQQVQQPPSTKSKAEKDRSESGHDTDTERRDLEMVRMVKAAKAAKSQPLTPTDTQQVGRDQQDEQARLREVARAQAAIDAHRQAQIDIQARLQAQRETLQPLNQPASSATLPVMNGVQKLAVSIVSQPPSTRPSTADTILKPPISDSHSRSSSPFKSTSSPSLSTLPTPSNRATRLEALIHSIQQLELRQSRNEKELEEVQATLTKAQMEKTKLMAERAAIGVKLKCLHKAREKVKEIPEGEAEQERTNSGEKTNQVPTVSSATASNSAPTTAPVPAHHQSDRSRPPSIPIPKSLPPQAPAHRTLFSAGPFYGMPPPPHVTYPMDIPPPPHPPGMFSPYGPMYMHPPPHHTMHDYPAMQGLARPPPPPPPPAMPPLPKKPPTPTEVPPGITATNSSGTSANGTQKDLAPAKGSGTSAVKTAIFASTPPDSAMAKTAPKSAPLKRHSPIPSRVAPTSKPGPDSAKPRSRQESLDEPHDPRDSFPPRLVSAHKGERGSSPSRPKVVPPPISAPSRSASSGRPPPESPDIPDPRDSFPPRLALHKKGQNMADGPKAADASHRRLATPMTATTPRSAIRTPTSSYTNGSGTPRRRRFSRDSSSSETSSSSEELEKRSRSNSHGSHSLNKKSSPTAATLHEGKNPRVKRWIEKQWGETIAGRPKGGKVRVVELQKGEQEKIAKMGKSHEGTSHAERGKEVLAPAGEDNDSATKAAPSRPTGKTTSSSSIPNDSAPKVTAESSSHRTSLPVSHGGFPKSPPLDDGAARAMRSPKDRGPRVDMLYNFGDTETRTWQGHLDKMGEKNTMAKDTPEIPGQTDTSTSTLASATQKEVKRQRWVLRESSEKEPRQPPNDTPQSSMEQIATPYSNLTSTALQSKSDKSAAVVQVDHSKSNQCRAKVMMGPPQRKSGTAVLASFKMFSPKLMPVKVPSAPSDLSQPAAKDADSGKMLETSVPSPPPRELSSGTKATSSLSVSESTEIPGMELDDAPTVPNVEVRPPATTTAVAMGVMSTSPPHSSLVDRDVASGQSRQESTVKKTDPPTAPASARQFTSPENSIQPSASQKNRISTETRPVHGQQGYSKECPVTETRQHGRAQIDSFPKEQPSKQHGHHSSVQNRPLPSTEKTTSTPQSRSTTPNATPKTPVERRTTSPPSEKSVKSLPFGFAGKQPTSNRGIVVARSSMFGSGMGPMRASPVKSQHLGTLKEGHESASIEVAQSRENVPFEKNDAPGLGVTQQDESQSRSQGSPDEVPGIAVPEPPLAPTTNDPVEPIAPAPVKAQGVIDGVSNHPTKQIFVQEFAQAPSQVIDLTLGSSDEDDSTKVISSANVSKRVAESTRSGDAKRSRIASPDRNAKRPRGVPDASPPQTSLASKQSHSSGSVAESVRKRPRISQDQDSAGSRSRQSPMSRSSTSHEAEEGRRRRRDSPRADASPLLTHTEDYDPSSPSSARKERSSHNERRYPARESRDYYGRERWPLSRDWSYGRDHSRERERSRARERSRERSRARDRSVSRERYGRYDETRTTRGNRHSSDSVGSSLSSSRRGFSHSSQLRDHDVEAKQKSTRTSNNDEDVEEIPGFSANGLEIPTYEDVPPEVNLSEHDCATVSVLEIMD